MTKITCIVGSARPDGSSNYLIDTFIRKLDKSVQVKKYRINEIKMNYCCACKKCYKSGECIQTDEVKNVILDIFNSDYVVIAAPSYWADVPAQLKTLFDRTTPYGDTNPNRKYKPQKPITGIAIAVRAGTHKEENELILNSIQHYFGHLGIETKKRFSICGTDSLNDLLEKHQTEIQELCNFARQIT